MLGLSARSGALAAGFGLVAALASPLGPMAYADETVPPSSTDVPVTEVPATDVPATDVPVTVPDATTPAVVAPVAQPVSFMRYGTRSSAVVGLEKRMMMKADRVFDGNTKKKVETIQRWAHIKPTGVVDAATSNAITRWHKMMAAKIALAKKKAAAKNSVSAKLKRIIKTARAYKGRPYRYGATGPRAFDCSGYTRYVVSRAIGKSLPHQSGGQASRVKKISRSSARPGDLIFFRSGGHVYHVGIYAGGNKLWHASRPGTKSGLGTIFSSNVSFGRVV